MTDRSKEAGFLRDLKVASAPRIAIKGRVSHVPDFDRRLRLESPRTVAELRGSQCTLLGVPVSDEIDRLWRVQGTVSDDGAIEIDSIQTTAATSDEPKFSRTSARVERPDCRVRLRRPRGTEELAGTCLDISAGGVGLRTSESFAYGEPVEVDVNFTDSEHTLRGYVAHSGAGRVGVQFAPLTESAATEYYEALNAFAGERLAGLEVSRETLPEFYEALQEADTRMLFDGAETLDAGSLRLSPAAERLAPLIRRVEVESENGTWVADVLSSEGDSLVISHVGRVGTPDVDTRASGYRVRPPASTRLSVSRASNGEPLPGKIVDLSRGGVGLELPADVHLRSMERVEIAVEIPGVLADKFSGRVVYLRREEDGRARVGVRFIRVQPAQELALHRAISRLENRLVLGRVLVFGGGILLFLLALILIGQLFIPQRQPSPDATGSPTGGAEAEPIESRSRDR